MSQIMEKVLETEKTCDERVRAAKTAALETAAEADRKAELILERAREKAGAISDDIIAEAKLEAKKIAAEGKKRSDAAADALRKDAEEKYDLASKAVASTLLKIS